MYPAGWIFFDIVNVCNLRCPFCSVDYSAIRKGKIVDEATFDNVIKLADVVADGYFALSCSHEPTMHPRFAELLGRIPDNRRQKFYFTSNMATKISDETISAIATSNFDRINVSTDTLDPELFKVLRKNGDLRVFLYNFKRLVAALKNSPRAPKLSLITMGFRSNYAEMEALVRFGLEHGCVRHEIRFLFDVPHIPDEFKKRELLTETEWEGLAEQFRHDPRVHVIAPPPGYVYSGMDGGDTASESGVAAGGHPSGAVEEEPYSPTYSSKLRTTCLTDDRPPIDSGFVLFINAYGNGWIYDVPPEKFLVDVNQLADPVQFFRNLVEAPNLIEARMKNVHIQLTPLHIDKRFRNLSEDTRPEVAAQLFVGELYCEWFSPAPLDVLRIAFVCERDGEYLACRDLHLNVTGGIQSLRFRISDMSELFGVLTADNLNQVLIGGEHASDLDIWVGLRLKAHGSSHDFFQMTPKPQPETFGKSGPVEGYPTNSRRSLPFKHRSHNRYWWFQNRVHDYVPALFAVLTDEEWDIMDQWYADTDARQSAGEANVPPLSFLMSMIDGNGISNIVQLGHFEGFSTLLLGFTMRRMGFKHSVFSVDISEGCSRYCEHWVTKAGLSDYVSINVASSDTPGLPEAARNYFGSEIETVFIDSSHQYQHTLNELELWFPALKTFGFIFLHDASTGAAGFDALQGGGVIRAVKEWSRRADAAHMLVNEDVVPGDHLHEIVYQDGCGLGIIQKRRRCGV